MSAVEARPLGSFDTDPCVCGHRKCVQGETHFFGDPRPGESFDPWCMVAGCTCKKYQPLTPALLDEAFQSGVNAGSEGTVSVDYALRAYAADRAVAQ